jgi:LCP family protein required for cell wall assembly
MSKKNRKKNKKSPNFKVFMTIFILAIIITSGVFTGVKIFENGGGLKGVVATVLGENTSELSNLKTINVLLLGISEDLNSKLTDTIMVCSYNPKTQRASILSIPRDTYVGKNKNSVKANDKLNTVYSKSGIDTCMEKVEQITGIELDYYAVVNTKALIKIVDIIGGVNFDVPIKMNYDDPTQNLHIHLNKGMQKINGEKAEQLLRFRHNNNGSTYSQEYGDNDYGRMKTQREFIKETMKQTLQLKNITKAKKIISAVFENVNTNVEEGLIKQYLPYAIEFNTDSILMEQLPGESTKYKDVWVYEYNKKETTSLVKEIQNHLDNIEEKED